MLAVLAWTSTFLSRFTAWPGIEYFLLFGMLTIATYGVYAIGSVTSPLLYFYVAGVAAAGTFMNRRMLILTIAFSLIALAVLATAEVRGLLPAYVVKVNWRHWFTQGIVIVVVGAMVFYNRQRIRKATQSRNKEITRRIAIERELERNLKRFSRLFRNNPSPMLAPSARDGTILDVNPAFERSYGYTREAVLGRRDNFLWVQKDARKAHVKRLAIERIITQVPALGVRADSSHFSALISSEKDDDIDDNLIITTITDVRASPKPWSNCAAPKNASPKPFTSARCPCRSPDMAMASCSM
jgi:PAS domain S-box-containing protein